MKRDNFILIFAVGIVAAVGFGVNITQLIDALDQGISELPSQIKNTVNNYTPPQKTSPYIKSLSHNLKVSQEGDTTYIDFITGAGSPGGSAGISAETDPVAMANISANMASWNSTYNATYAAATNFTANVSGNTPVANYITFVNGSNVTLTQTGNNITIDSIGSSVNTSAFELTANKNIASGYAGLDANGYIATAQLKNLSPAPIVQNSHDAQVSTGSTSPTKLKTITLNENIKGGIRISFQIFNSNGVTAAYGQIYKNGSVWGTQRSTSSSSPVDFSEDFTGLNLPAGTAIQLYVWINNAGPIAYAQNFRLMYNVIPEVSTTNS